MKSHNCPVKSGYSFFTIAIVCLFGLIVPLVNADAPGEKTVDAPLGLHVSIKMVGPVTQVTDLQIICVLKHNPAGDKYIEAMKDFNDHLGGLLSSLRDRGEFVGDAGETLLITPPANSIAPTRVLLIGVGEESELTLDRLSLAGRIAARESAGLGAVHVSFAPTLRDQGSTRIDVADGDAAVVEQFVLAADTVRRLEAQGLAPADKLADFTIEAGQKYFDGAVAKVTAAVSSAAEQIKHRTATQYTTHTAK